MLEAALIATSLWVTPVPDNSHYATAVSSNVAVGLDTWQAPDIWSIPLYSAVATDPAEPVLYNPCAWYAVAMGYWQRSGNSPTTEAQILASSSPAFPFAGNPYSSTSTTNWVLPAAFDQIQNPANGPAQFHFNAAMLPAQGLDGHMAVQQPDGTVVETYSTIVLSTGQIVALSYDISNPSGLGDGSQDGQTASMLPCYLGVIDDAELSGPGITHAMAVTVPAQMLKPQIAYPAFAFDRDAMTRQPPYSGSMAMGSRLAIPSSVEISKLGLLTPEGEIIAAAAQTYGFIIVDRGGEGISLRVRHNPSVPDAALHQWNWRLQSDLTTIFHYVHKVS